MSKIKGESFFSKKRAALGAVCIILLSISMPKILATVNFQFLLNAADERALFVIILVKNVPVPGK